MESTLGWLDYSDAERRRMQEVINLFRERGILDELGLGAIRDAFADHFFPGTSTIQTRARYLLFIPSIYRRIEREEVPSDVVDLRVRQEQLRLAEALEKGGERNGLIGGRAKENIQRFPHSIYWNGLRTYGICSFQGSIENYHRSLDGYYSALSRRAQDDIEEDREYVAPNWHPGVPHPPKGWLKETTFELSEDEASYLSERIATNVGGSLLGLVVNRQPDLTEVEQPWHLPDVMLLPPALTTELAHAERFSFVMHGAVLLYNVLLAELADTAVAQQPLQDRFESWASRLSQRCDELSMWDRSDFWRIIRRLNPRIGPPLQQFVDGWFNLAMANTNGLASNEDAQRLLRLREVRLKGRYARLTNPSAREDWTGGGAGRLNFRWNDTRRIAADILRRPVTVPRGTADA